MKNTTPREFAIEAHGAQLYGDTEPYVVHLDAVAAILQEFGITDPDSLAAAYLHDVLEDTRIGWHELEFGLDVTLMVLFCTDEPGPNRKTRKALTYARIRRELDAKAADPVVRAAVCVKLTDRVANIRQSVTNNPGLLEMYRKEKSTFQAALSVPDEFRSEAMRALWAEYGRLLG